MERNPTARQRAEAVVEAMESIFETGGEGEMEDRITQQIEEAEATIFEECRGIAREVAIQQEAYGDRGILLSTGAKRVQFRIRATLVERQARYKGPKYGT